MGSFLGLFFRDFNGGSKSDQILGSGGHAIRLWFALVGIFVDCPFLRPRGPIEVIEMIEVIEVIRWPLAGDTLRKGSDGGVESRPSWILGVSAMGVGMGFTYGLGVF